MNTQYTLHQGNCLDILKTMEQNSIDSIVTDPPYGLSNHSQQEVVECLQAWILGNPYTPKGKGFMGKEWDSWVPGPEIWKECIRVLKPGGHVLAFAGTRSMDLMCMSIRLAGFELRDSIGFANDGSGAPLLSWCYGSGFPKSLDVSKAIDKGCQHDATTHVTESARQWQGWGTALKPAWEPIILARKPLSAGTVAENVLEWGTGAINIDGCRVESGGEHMRGEIKSRNSGGWVESGGMHTPGRGFVATDHPGGRWPANLIHDGSKVVLAGFPDAKGAVSNGKRMGNGYGEGFGSMVQAPGYCDTGSAARFFYCAKASRKDRNEGLEDPGPQFKHGVTLRNIENTETKGNNHPTVKPTELMRYLVRLVTPPNGIVFDPFTGSGSTGKAAILEGFRFVGCEMSPEYIDIATARIEHALLNSESSLFD